jgi:hypothetical protein
MSGRGNMMMVVFDAVASSPRPPLLRDLQRLPYLAESVEWAVKRLVLAGVLVRVGPRVNLPPGAPLAVAPGAARPRETRGRKARA